MKKRAAIFPTLAFAVLTALAPRGLSAEPNRELRVGLVTSLAGAAGVNGASIRDAVLLAKKRLESEGWKVDLAVEDDATQSAKTISGLRALQGRGYKLFIGFTWSFLADAAAPIISRSKVVALSPANSSESAGGAHDGMFFLSPRSSLKSASASEWIKRTGIKHPVLITPLGSWGEVHRTMYLDVLKAQGINPVLDERYGYGEEEGVMRSLISRFRKLGVDAILTTNTPEGEAILQRRLSEQQLPLPVLTTENVFEAVSLNLMKPTELISTIDAFVRDVSPKFRADFKSEYHRDPLMYADTGYDALLILAEAVAAVGEDPAKVKDYLSSKLHFKGASGEISFDHNGDVASADYVTRRVGEGLKDRLAE